MKYKTINVSPVTYERMKMYIHAGQSMDIVLNRLMDIIDPEDFYLEYLEEHKKRVERMKEGDYVKASDLEDLLEES